METTIGYQPEFLGKTNRIELPTPSAILQKDVLKIKNTEDNLLHHLQYSVLLSQSRKLAIFSAANLDGKLKQKINRTELKSSWSVEKNIAKTDVFTNELYKLSKQKLERGHLTPADAMEWGADISAGKLNANDTFFFSNAAPQIKRLNGTEWGHLEAFVGKESMKAGNARISVHTGCVFLKDDPEYIHEIEGSKPQIPRFFWKVAYYLNKNDELCRIGFLMGQEDLLKKSELTQLPDLEAAVLHPKDATDAFQDLLKNKTFQVNIALIEKMSKLKFSPAKDKITDNRRIELTMKEIDLMQRESFNLNHQMAEDAHGLQNLELDGLLF
jgi:endonuclease G, mitochondrial